MPGLPTLQPETIAFWLGFLAATLFWWLVSRIRPLVPKLVEYIRNQIRANQRKSQEKLDEYLRRETLRRSQGLHLAAPLFALDEILVAPRLLAPPTSILGSQNPAADSIANQVLPYTPDWPELASQFNVPTLRLEEAIQNRARIVVVGQPGAGKTVQLAHFASQLARKDAHLGEFSQHFPILLHALDLPLASDPGDPFDILVKAVAGQSPVLIQPQIPRFLKSVLSESQAILLLDGLDELSADDLQKTTGYLTLLLQKYPTLLVVTTGSFDNLDGLTRLGFFPLAVAAWKPSQSLAFVKQWGSQWKNLVIPELVKRSLAPAEVDERLLTSWLTAEGVILTPLEWTLRVWGAYSGDVTSSANADSIDAFLVRQTQNALPPEALARLAFEFVQQSKAALTYNHLEGILSKFKVAATPAGDAAGKDGVPTSDKTPRTKRKSAKGERKVSSGGRILSILLECGILVEHPGEQIRFVSPVIGGFLAAYASQPEALASLPEQHSLAISKCAAHYYAVRTADLPALSGLLATEDDPLYRSFFEAARWLKDAPASLPWRPALLKRMVTLAQREDLPLSIRARIIAAFLCANDPSVTMLFKQLIASPSPGVRQLAALGCGAIRAVKLADDLMNLLGDPIPNTRYAACMALAVVNEKTAKESLPQILLHGDEGLQLAAAESLAASEEGVNLLKEALVMDNLLVRRAAVLGLAQVRETWALKLLEKVAVEDAQWVVRSAAVQAVEIMQKPNPFIPAPLPPAGSAGWLITYASKQGVGVPPDQVPVELLVSALKNGSTDEKLSALLYLRDIPEEGVMRAIYQVAFCDQPILQDAGLYAIQTLAASGAKLPAAQKYGLG